MAGAIPALDTRWPIGPLQIDCSDPLMQGIDMFVTWNVAGRPMDIARPQTAPITLTTAPGWRVTPYGVGGYATGGSSFDTPTRKAVYDFPTYGRDWTIRIVGFPISWPGAFTALLDDVGRRTCLFFDASGVFDFGNFSFASPTGLTLPAGKIFDIVCVAIGTSPFTTVFYNLGVVNNSTTFTGSNIADSISFGRNVSGGGLNADCVYHIYQQWTRALNPAEIFRLRSEPYAGTIATALNHPRVWSSLIASTGLPCGAIMM